MAVAVEQGEVVVGDLAILEGGGERTVEDEEETGTVAGWKRYWKLMSGLDGEEETSLHTAA